MEAVEELKNILHYQWSTLNADKNPNNIGNRQKRWADISNASFNKVKPEVNIKGIYNRMNKCLEQNDKLLNSVLNRWETCL